MCVRTCALTHFSPHQQAILEGDCCQEIEGGRPTNSIKQELADLNFTLVVTLKCELNPWPTLHSISSERTKWWKTYGSLG